MEGGRQVEQAINKLASWYGVEQETLDDLAHDVAQAHSVDEMMRAKASYEVQHAKVETLLEAIRLVESTK